MIHGGLLVVLALLVLSRELERPIPELIVSSSQPTGLPEQFGHQPLLEEAPIVAAVTSAVRSPALETSIDIELEDAEPGSTRSLAEQSEPAVFLRGIGGRKLEGRAPAGRGGLLAKHGGTPHSEQAVARGLRWLVAHQLRDGSWRLNHHKSPNCPGLCRNPGNIGSSTAGTALALLPLLGAGHTHVEGEHSEAVRRGIYYLRSRMVLTEHGGDLQEGTMYAQGLATIALCEAYAMTGDAGLQEIAQSVVDFIVDAQHPAGGWRYLPGQPGDTTSFGWQLMALKSGRLGRLHVPQPTLYAASRFLDSVQSYGGARYGYQKPEHNFTTTAIGLLCRMYLGWPREHPALTRGVAQLANRGPSPTNMYYNYYATQVLHHYEGPYWSPWNTKLREHLIATQASEGHEAGSWYFDDTKTKPGGRLYNTAIAVMILEVYYRYLPLYGREAIE